MSRTTWKAEVSDSAVQSMTVLREPIQTTEKWRWKFFSALRTERSSLRASIHCLRKWPYHFKIPHTSAVANCILKVRKLLYYSKQISSPVCVVKLSKFGLPVATSNNVLAVFLAVMFLWVFTRYCLCSSNEEMEALTTPLAMIVCSKLAAVNVHR